MTKTLTDTEHKLLTALWRHVMKEKHASFIAGPIWECGECGRFAGQKHLVQHAPGCALFGLDPALLAGLDEFDRVTP